MSIALRAVVLLELIGVLSCGGRSPASTTAASPPAAPVPAARALLPDRFAPHGAIVIGDVHGTREIPVFVGRIVTELTAREPVVLGLEIPSAELPSLDGFLASDGGPAAREAALRDPWWHGAHQDGRRSVAMFELIDTVRRLRARGARIDVVCFDESAPGAESRDEAMASKLIAARTAHRDAALVVYVGNYHARRAELRSRPGYAWMAMHMAKAGVAFMTIDARYGEGSAWTCNGRSAADCGAHYTAGYEVAGPGIRLEASPDGGYDGWFGVGSVSASPPAALPELAVGLDAKLAALPGSPDAHRSRARRAVRENDHARCIAELGRLESPSAEDAYSLACCHALAGNRDAAFDQLRAARARGYRDLDAAKADPDLASLHDDPRWPAVLTP
jgi:hypothetical protein